MHLIIDKLQLSSDSICKEVGLCDIVRAGTSRYDGSDLTVNDCSLQSSDKTVCMLHPVRLHIFNSIAVGQDDFVKFSDCLDGEVQPFSTLWNF